MIKEIKFTDKALKQINTLLSKKDKGSFFRIAIKGGGCSGFQYEFTFDKSKAEDDLNFENILIDKASADLLKGASIKPSICFTSYLKRAQNTLDIILKELNLESLPVHRSWKLNERHYGALQGLNKDDVKKMKNNYLEGGYGYGHAKTNLLNLILDLYKQERNLYNKLLKNPDHLYGILEKGENKARAIAKSVLDRVKNKLGY